jgi:hypothetical protein
LPEVERRHSPSAALTTRAEASRLPFSFWNASMSRASQNSRSYLSHWRWTRPILIRKPTMIVQTQTLASTSPPITAFTTMSA